MPLTMNAPARTHHDPYQATLAAFNRTMSFLPLARKGAGRHLGPMRTPHLLTFSMALSLVLHLLLVSGCEAPLPAPPRLKASVTPVTVRAPLEAVVVGRRLPKSQLQCGQDLKGSGPAARASEPEARLPRSQLHQAME